MKPITDPVEIKSLLEQAAKLASLNSLPIFAEHLRAIQLRPAYDPTHRAFPEADLLIADVKDAVFMLRNDERHGAAYALERHLPLLNTLRYVYHYECAGSDR